MKTLLIDLQFMPPIAYFALLKQYDRVLLERHENFQKSTFRNRCNIAGVHGLLKLSIPVLGGKDHHQQYKEVSIQNEEAWQHLHWQSLCAAYRRSPYFEYYEDGLEPFFHQQYTNLWAFNEALLKHLLGLLNIETSIDYTNEWFAEAKNMDDYRGKINPKSIPAEHPRYIQVFEDRHSFLPNLSIADLLFNLGPQANEWLDYVKIGQNVEKL